MGQGQRGEGRQGWAEECPARGVSSVLGLGPGAVVLHGPGAQREARLSSQYHRTGPREVRPPQGPLWTPAVAEPPSTPSSVLGLWAKLIPFLLPPPSVRSALCLHGLAGGFAAH